MGYGNATTYRGVSRHEGVDVDIPAVHALPRAAFYIFGEKGQMKVRGGHGHDLNSNVNVSSCIYLIVLSRVSSPMLSQNVTSFLWNFMKFVK